MTCFILFPLTIYTTSKGIPLPSCASLNELRHAVKNLLPSDSGEFYLEYVPSDGSPSVALVNPEGMRIFRDSARKSTSSASINTSNVVIVKWREQLVRSTPSPKPATMATPPSRVLPDFGMLHHFEMESAQRKDGRSKGGDDAPEANQPSAASYNRRPPVLSTSSPSVTGSSSFRQQHKKEARPSSKCRHANVRYAPFGGPSLGSMVEAACNELEAAIHERRCVDKKIVNKYRELKGDLSLARHATAKILSKERNTARQAAAANEGYQACAADAAVARREAAVAISAIAAASAEFSCGARSTLQAVGNVGTSSSRKSEAWTAASPPPSPQPSPQTAWGVDPTRKLLVPSGQVPVTATVAVASPNGSSPVNMKSSSATKVRRGTSSCTSSSSRSSSLLSLASLSKSETPRKLPLSRRHSHSSIGSPGAARSRPTTPNPDKSESEDVIRCHAKNAAKASNARRKARRRSTPPSPPSVHLQKPVANVWSGNDPSKFSQNEGRFIHGSEAREMLDDTGLPAPFEPLRQRDVSGKALSAKQLPFEAGDIPTAFATARVSAASPSNCGTAAAADVAPATKEATVRKQVFSLSMKGSGSAVDAPADTYGNSAAAGGSVTDLAASLDGESLARLTGSVFSNQATERGSISALPSGNSAVGKSTPPASMVTKRAAAANQSSTIATPEWRPTPIKKAVGGSSNGNDATLSSGASSSTLASWQQPSQSTPVHTRSKIGSRLQADAENTGVSFGSIQLSWGNSPAAAFAPTLPIPSQRRPGRVLPAYPSSTKQKKVGTQSSQSRGSPRRPFGNIQQSVVKPDKCRSASKMKASETAGGKTEPRTSVVFESTHSAQCTNIGCNAKFDPFEPSGCRYHAAAVDWRASTGYYWPCCQANSTTYLSYTAASRTRGCVEGKHAESTSLLTKSMTASRAPPTGSKAGTLGARIKIRLSENLAQ